MIYLDNAATSRYMPIEVLNAYVGECAKKSNPGRGGHSDSIDSGLKVFHARERLNAFFNNINGECVFTKNCTEALNLAILGTAKKGRVVTTVTEHNSVLRPLSYLTRKKQIEVSYARPDDSGAVTWDSVKPLLTDDTYLVIVNCCSNVTGKENDYQGIFEECSNRGILTLADGAQIAGHKRFDMQKTNCDMFATSGHKGLLGMQGTGALLFSKKIKINPIIYGGTGTDSIMTFQPCSYPESLEAGTLNTAGICALQKAVEWCDKNLERVAYKNKSLSQTVIDGLSELNRVKIYSSANTSGIVSFIIKGIDSESIADHLNENRVAVRAGLHCAPLMHKHLGTLSSGLVRVSVGYDNDYKQVNYFLKVMQKYIENNK